MTPTGFVTDENFNVLQGDYTTLVKGLCAAGSCLGHRFGPGYSTPSAGCSMGMAMTHGRVLGKIVAALWGNELPGLTAGGFAADKHVKGDHLPCEYVQDRRSFV